MNMDPDEVDTIEASPEITDEVTAMLRKTGIRALQEAEQYIRKSGGKPVKKTDLRAEFTTRLSAYITQGMVRLTIEKVKASDEVQQSLKDTHSPYTIVLKKIAPLKLPEYSPFITIAIGSGAAELFRTDATFVVKSAIVLQDTRITLHEKKFREFKFGSLNAAMSIYLKKDQVKEQLHSFSRDLTVPGFMSHPGR
ncbi:MAG: hypothetical protein HGA40_03665 [Methanoregulaceae archaeon]|nr:hypothetical protein [Methanoregulaceae archaeon]